MSAFHLQYPSTASNSLLPPPPQASSHLLNPRPSLDHHFGLSPLVRSPFSSSSLTQVPALKQQPPDFRRAETLGARGPRDVVDVLTHTLGSSSLSAGPDFLNLYQDEVCSDDVFAKPSIFRSDSFHNLYSKNPPELPKYQRHISVPTFLPTCLQSCNDPDPGEPLFQQTRNTAGHLSLPVKSASVSPVALNNGQHGWNESFNVPLSPYDHHRAFYDPEFIEHRSETLSPKQLFSSSSSPYTFNHSDSVPCLNLQNSQQHFSHSSSHNNNHHFHQPNLSQGTPHYQRPLRNPYNNSLSQGADSTNHKSIPYGSKSIPPSDFSQQNTGNRLFHHHQQSKGSISLSYGKQQHTPHNYRHASNQSQALYHPRSGYNSARPQYQPTHQAHIYNYDHQFDTTSMPQYGDSSRSSSDVIYSPPQPLPGYSPQMYSQGAHFLMPTTSFQSTHGNPQLQTTLVGYQGENHAHQASFNYANQYNHFEFANQPVAGLNFTMQERQVQRSAVPPMVPDPKAYALDKQLGPLVWAPTPNPIIRINNISWDVTIFDIQSYLYPLEIAHLGGLPLVHVLMIRETGKTRSDAYVEFDTMNDAMVALRERQRRVLRGRIVTIHRATQAELLRLTFPSFSGDFNNVDAVLGKQNGSVSGYLSSNSSSSSQVDLSQHIALNGPKESDNDPPKNGPIPPPHGAASWNEAFAALQLPVRVESVTPETVTKTPIPEAYPPQNSTIKAGPRMPISPESRALSPNNVKSNSISPQKDSFDDGCFFISRTEINQCLAICKNFKLFFSRKCPQRPFETVIVILLKFPWHQKHLLTTMQRDHIFELTKLSVEMLCGHLSKPANTIDRTLLDRMLRAMLMVPAFTEKQKNIILEASNSTFAADEQSLYRDLELLDRVDNSGQSANDVAVEALTREADNNKRVIGYELNPSHNTSANVYSLPTANHSRATPPRKTEHEAEKSHIVNAFSGAEMLGYFPTSSGGAQESAESHVGGADDPRALSDAGSGGVTSHFVADKARNVDAVSLAYFPLDSDPVMAALRKEEASECRESGEDQRDV